MQQRVPWQQAGGDPQTAPAQQTPWVHEVPAPQGWPQVPQLEGSVAVFTHAFEQLVRPAGQHLPREQVWLPLQVVPQLPQFRPSVRRSTQRGLALAQKVAPMQAHAPALHVPRPHCTPQAPQFVGLVERFTQVPAQFTVPAGQHFPLLHVEPPAQTTPHAPQFDGSSSTFTQAPPQLTSPASQQRPALHV